MPDGTLIVALWGAVLSTVLAVLKLSEFRKDRAILRVSVRGGYKKYPPDPVEGDYGLVLIDAVNIGRRPASIVSASLLLPDGKHLVCVGRDTGRYPVELTEGKSHSFTLNEDKIKEKYKLSASQYVAVVADATGKRYYSHSVLGRLWRIRRFR